MKIARLEVVVGAFVLLGIVSLGYISVQLGDVEFFGRKGYTVYADFDSVSGLQSGAAVEIAGVEVGKVERITLYQGRARVALKINDQVVLQEDVFASIKSRGIIGDKFVFISLGGSEILLKSGGVIHSTESAAALEDLISQLIHGKVE